MRSGARSGRAIAVEIFGTRLVLETRLDALVAAVMARLPAPQPPSARVVRERRYVVEAAGAGIVIRQDARRPANAASFEAAADLIVNDLQRALAHHADGLVFVHAGAVVWRGRALVLPGRSTSGKSELVAALLRAGADYLSDEFAVFDAAGRVHPYARPIALRSPGGRRVRWAPETLGARTRVRPAPPGLIAFLRFSAGSRWRPRRLSPGRTLLGLLRHTVAARRRLALVRSVLVPVASSITAIDAVRGEAGDLAEALLRELASPRPFGTVALRTSRGR